MNQRAASKILLGTDFSETATRASEIAIAFAKRARAQLVLLHVSEPPTHALLEMATDARAFEQGLRERAGADLRAAAAEARAQHLEVEERLATGEPARVIAQLANEIDAQLVVLGSHGRRALPRLLLGSVAQETLLLTSAPLLVARRGATVEGIERWAAGGPPLRVTLALDVSMASKAAVTWLRWLRGQGAADIRCVHVYDPVIEAFRAGPHPGPDGKESLESTRERELRALVGELPGEGRVTFALCATPERPAEALVREAEAAGSDLVVVGSPRRAAGPSLWLGSTAELVLRRARLPVVCVPGI